MESPGAESSPPDRPLNNVRLIITDINIEYKIVDLQSLSCLCDEDIWSLGGDDKIMRICNAPGGGGASEVNQNQVGEQSMEYTM